MARWPRASESTIKANLQPDHTGPIAKLEPSPGLPSLEAHQVQEATSKRVLVRVTSYRKRLLDEDNLCEKYHVDLCRYAGILRSDQASQTKIEVAQVKIKGGEPEQVVVEIYSGTGN